MFWTMVAGGLILTALVGRVAAQSGFDLGHSGKRPTIISLIGFLFFPLWIVIFIVAATTAKFFPTGSNVLAGYVPDLVSKLAVGTTFVAIAIFPVSVPLLMGMPIGFLAGYWFGRRRSQRLSHEPPIHP